MQVLDCLEAHVFEYEDHSSLPRRFVLGCNYNFLLDLDRPEVLSITDCVQGVTEKGSFQAAFEIVNPASTKQPAVKVVRQQEEVRT
jgi:hypothetical protein